MIPETVLGMTLEDALARLAAEGITPVVTHTEAPPRRNAPPQEAAARRGATLRVIRVRGNELTVAAFLDAMPDTAAFI